MKKKSKSDKMFLYVHISTDDECFYVGMAHPAQSARKGNNYVPNDYRPFQCCPTKLERQTRVPKMSAQRLSQKKDSNEKSRFEFSSASGANAAKKTETKIKSEPTLKKATTTSSTSSSSSSTTTTTNKKPTKHNDDDDNHKEIKKPAAKKEANKPKPGQKGLLGIAKIVNWF